MPIPRWETLTYRYTHDDWFLEKEEPPTNGEVNYTYVKGKGWIPETPLSLALKSRQEREERERKFREEQAERDRENRARAREYRQRGRAANFGYLGGMEARSYDDLFRRMQRELQEAQDRQLLEYANWGWNETQQAYTREQDLRPNERLFNPERNYANETVQRRQPTDDTYTVQWDPDAGWNPPRWTIRLG